MEDERWLMMAVLDHLQKVSKRGDVREEPIQEAIFAIANAYSLNMHNSATKERYPLDGLSLPEVFKAGRDQLLGRGPSNTTSGAAPVAPGTEAMDIEKSSTLESDQVFMKFVARLKESTSFFKDVEEGSEEYERRLSRAREKYLSKRAEKKKRQTDGAAAGSSMAGETSAALAEKVKIEGNTALKAKNYQKAHDLYTKCIELDRFNAVYYSNRAAANLHLSRYSEAVEDCKRAIALDASFVRPRERLAASYRCLGMTQNEVDALKGALQLAPHNESFLAQLRDAEARLANGGGEEASAANPTASRGMGLESLLGMSPDPNMLSNMGRAMGLNISQESVQSLLNSGAADQIGNMIRDNPGVVQQAMQAVMGMGGGNPNNNANGNANDDGRG